ncbi:MAG: flippase-like domain-containing protein [Bacteroidales bacterium]|nr:flippase-like domain-containing protein [Bacteroidales bacterium]
MNEKVSKFLKYILSVAVAAVLLWFSFREVEWKEFWNALSRCRWEFVLMSMAFGLCSFFIRALRWRLILLPIDPKTKRITCFNAVNISYVANMVLPRVGELVRCGYITADSSKNEKGEKLASYDKVLGTVVVDRSSDVLMMLLLFIPFSIIGWSRFGSFFMEKIVTPVAAGFNFWYLLAIVALIAAAVFAVKKVKFFGGVWNGFKACFHMDQVWLFIFYSFLLWTLYWLMSMSILWAVQGISPELLGGIDGLDIFFLMIVGSLSSLVPVPGGFGAFHYLLCLALTTVYGIPPHIAIVFATLSHESQVVIQAIAGFVSYVWESVRSRKPEAGFEELR